MILTQLGHSDYHSFMAIVFQSIMIFLDDTKTLNFQIH